METRFTGTRRYIADESLMADVDASIVLGRPLLVKGEPGTGKTLLAHAVSESLGMPLLVWSIKSTTKAIDGLYSYDVVQRLNDARFGDGDVKDLKRYIRLGMLGRAFAADVRHVVLIDEVDKADLEFPNDLLRELDEMVFHIPELDETIAARQRPVVIITSNAEKELPDAFLRRCVFHYIAFPDRERMRRIVDVHLPGLSETLLEAAFTRFYALRRTEGLRKKPSTSELVDWLTVLARMGVPPEDIAAKFPFAGLLLKQEADLELVRNRRG
jgi:MoxR-like ATPase